MRNPSKLLLLAALGLANPASSISFSEPAPSERSAPAPMSGAAIFGTPTLEQAKEIQKMAYQLGSNMGLPMDVLYEISRMPTDSPDLRILLGPIQQALQEGAAGERIGDRTTQLVMEQARQALAQAQKTDVSTQDFTQAVARLKRMTGFVRLYREKDSDVKEFKAAASKAEDALVERIKADAQRTAQALQNDSKTLSKDALEAAIGSAPKTGSKNRLAPSSRKQSAPAKPASGIKTAGRLAGGPAYSLDASISAAAVAGYLKNGFSQDLQKAVDLASRLHGIDLRDIKNLSIRVGQVAANQEDNGVTFPTEGGATDRYTVNIAIHENYSVEDFKLTFFHELGHVIFYNYLNRNSAASREAAQAFVKMGDPAVLLDRTPEGVRRLKELRMLLSFGLQTQPFSELYADAFMAVYLRNPWKNQSRDFSKMSVDLTGHIPADDPHTAFNPVRGALWKYGMQKQLGDANAMLRLLNHLATISDSELETVAAQMKRIADQTDKVEFSMDIIKINGQMIDQLKNSKKIQ